MPATVIPYRRPLAERHIARSEHLFGQHQTHLDAWRQQADLFWPAKSDIFRGETPDGLARTRTLDLFDATGLRSRRLFAGNLQAAATNPALPWFELGFEDEELNDDAEVIPWMGTVSDRMLFAYNTSNFYQESFQHYAQLGVFGTACTYVGQRQDLWYESQVFALRFQTLYPGSYVIAEGASGRVDTVMRKLYFTPIQAVEQWREQAPERAKRIMRSTHYDSKMDEKEPYLHVVCPRAVQDPSRRDSRNLPFADVIIDLTDKKVVTELGWEEFPFLVSRYDREGQSAWGYGPGHEALPAAKTLNKLIMMWLQMVELHAQPALGLLNGALTGALRFAPLAVNILEQKDALFPLNIQGQPDKVVSEIARLQKEIRDAYHVDDLLAIPPPDATGKMTAYEVGQRIELMARFMGPVFVMLLADFLDPLMDRTFGLMSRASEQAWARGRDGVLPLVPREVLLAAQQHGGQIGVRYEGPLARSQKASHVRALDDLLNLLGKAAQVTARTDWVDNFDMDKGLRDSALALGNRRDLLRDTRQRDKIRATRVQEAAQAQQAQVLREGAAAFQQGTAGLVNLQEAQAA
jgi:hypothetical protein